MRQDSVSIARFYAGGLGQAAAWALSTRVVDLWGDNKDLNCLGLGYPLPLLAPFAKTAKRAVAVFPEGSGRVLWDGAGRGNATVIAPESRLPFPDGLFDRAVLLHALEDADNPRTLCRELWRVTAPEGRIIIAAVNRRGLWAGAERTPFGSGRPWTLRQLSTLLADCLFQVTASTHALFLPPLSVPILFNGAQGWEQAGRIAAPGFGGVVLVEAVKRLYIETGGGAVAPTLAAAKAQKGVYTVPREPTVDRQRSDFRRFTN